MKKLTGFLILAALLVIIVVQLMNNKEVSENRVYQYDKTQSITVQTERVKSSSADRSQYFTGTFEANKEVKLNADALVSSLRATQVPVWSSSCMLGTTGKVLLMV